MRGGREGDSNNEFRKLDTEIIYKSCRFELYLVDNAAIH